MEGRNKKAGPLNEATLRKVIREEVSHLATKDEVGTLAKSLDELAMSTERGFEDTVTKVEFKDGIEELKSGITKIKQKQFDNNTTVLAYERKVMSLDKRVETLETNAR